MKKYLIITLLLVLMAVPSFGQLSADRAGAMAVGMKFQAKTAIAQLTTLGLLSRQYSDIKENEDKIVDFQKQYEEYLDNFNDVISACACFYSIYWQVKQATHNIREVREAVEYCPTGVFAAAFQRTRNNVMKASAKNIAEMVTSITKIFTNKMTGKERMEELQKLENDLALFNSQLRALAEQIRYTSLVDLWNEYMGKFRRYTAQERGDVALDCMFNATLRLRERYAVWNSLSLPDGTLGDW